MADVIGGVLVCGVDAVGAVVGMALECCGVAGGVMVVVGAESGP